MPTRATEKDKSRIRFAVWDGGLNTNDEPYLIADNQYSEGANVVLENRVPQSRLGSVILDATNYGASQFKGICEYLYYDTDGVLTRYLIAAEGTNLKAWKWSGSAWAYVGNIYTLFTTGLWTSITNFKNKALITNGEEEPREYDINYSESLTYPMGLKAPNRIKDICDFHSTVASDIGYQTGQTYSSAAKIKNNVPGVDGWERPSDNVRHNDYCLELTEAANGGTDDFTISYTSGNPLDLTEFAGAYASDTADWIRFNLWVSGYDYLDVFELFIDFNNGLFNSDSYIQHQITREELDGNDWGGKNGGKYYVWISKAQLEKSMHGSAGVADWDNIRAIKFRITRATSASTTNAEPLTVYVDYLRMQESPPAATVTGKRIAGFEGNETWYTALTGTTGATLITTYKTEGITSARIINAGTSGVLRNVVDFVNYDLAHWDSNIPVRYSDCIAFDVWSTADVAALFSVRLLSDDKRIGWSGYTADWTAPPALGIMPGVLAAGAWNRVYIPIGWLLNMKGDGTKKSYSIYRTGTGHPITSDADESLDTWTAPDVLNSVEQIWIMALASTTTTMYIDNLKLEHFPVSKMIATFVGYRVEQDVDITTIKKRVDQAGDLATKGKPILNAAWNLAEWLLSAVIPDAWHIDFVLGETWTVSGTDDWMFDYSVRTFISSLRLKVEKNTAAIATHAFPADYDLTEFGTDGKFTFTLPGLTEMSCNGIPSDSSDVICMDVCVNKLDCLERIIVIFNCGDGTSDYFLYTIESTMLEKRSSKDKIKTSGFPELVPKLIQEATGISTKTEGTEFTHDMTWTTVKMRKSDFARYGTDTDAGWNDVKTVQCIVMASKEGDVTVWLDKMVMKSEGALNGEYRYKCVFRSDDTQSAPTDSSPPIFAAGVDCELYSLPVSDDSRVKYKDIYRIGGGNSAYRFLDTIPNDQVYYYDRREDWELGNVLDPDYEQPPVAKFGATHGNRYWLTNNKMHPSRVYYSRPFISGAFPEDNYIDIEPSAYGEVTGMISREDDLIVFKTNAVYRVVQGTDPMDKSKSAFWFNVIDNTIGCDAPRSIFCRNGVVYWIWRNKAYRMNGNNVDDRFGDPVKNLFENCHDNAESDPVLNHYACGCYHNDRALFAIKSASTSTYNDEIVSFNTAIDRWEGVHSGAGWSVNNMLSGYDGVLYAGASLSISSRYYLWKLFNGYTDNTAAIAAALSTKYVSGFEKRLEAYQAWLWAINKGTAAVNMTLQPILDYLITGTVSDTFSLAAQIAPQVSRIPIRGDDVGAFMGLRASASPTTGIVKFLMFILEAMAETDQ